MSLISSELFERALVAPLDNANRLYIVSGYATAVMAMRHIEYAKRTKKEFSIHLIVGMCPQDGIERTNHQGLLELHKRSDFECSYIVGRPPVHSKVYAWYNDDRPIIGFSGSANYTQNAFSLSMREVLTEQNPLHCKQYYDRILGETVNCRDTRIPELIDIFDRTYNRRADSNNESGAEVDSAIPNNIQDLNSVKLSLVDRYGEVPNHSGLNWGQRDGREPNQAYLQIPATVGRSGFFPDRYEQFTVVTDDDKIIICVRAQDGGKGLHSTLNNSLVGEYFRYRLGLANGAFITKDVLLRYGRTDVTFYKIDNENYFMDFAVR